MGKTEQFMESADLLPNTNGGTRTGKPSESAWLVTLQTLAQDKRHDLAPAVVTLWKEKLNNYRPEEINKALLGYRGKYFPSCDDVMDLMDKVRRRRMGEKPKREFIACRQNGCVDGWRPVSREKFSRYQRCQCLLDIAAVKGR